MNIDVIACIPEDPLANSTIEKDETDFEEDQELVEDSEKEEPLTKRPRLAAVADFDLHTFLKQHAVGEAILNIYDAEKALDPRCQSYLCENIITHFIDIKDL